MQQISHSNKYLGVDFSGHKCNTVPPPLPPNLFGFVLSSSWIHDHYNYEIWIYRIVVATEYAPRTAKLSILKREGKWARRYLNIIGEKL